MEMKEYVEVQRDLNREAMGFAHGYIQGLVAVGYAAVFFLWDKSEDRLSPSLWSAAGLLLCVSVGVYLAWEVFGFLFRQYMLMRVALAVGKPGEEIDVANFQAKTAETVEKLKFFLPKMRALWYPAMFGIVMPVALAWAVVLLAFASDLLRLLCG